MILKLVTLFYVTVIFASAGHLGTRVKRGIFNPVTHTVYRMVEEKHYVPYSCVHIEKNLPECRHLRFMWVQNPFNFVQESIANFSQSLNKEKTPEINKTEISRRMDNNIIDNSPVQEPEPIDQLGWGEYLGIYTPPSTVTELRIVPTTVQDRRIVITYALKGCKPKELPQGIESCPDESNEPEILEILPTQTVNYRRIEPTKIPDLKSIQQPEPKNLDLQGGESQGAKMPNTKEPTKHL